MRQVQYTLVDDRTEEEVNKTKGFVIATDNFMSGWGQAPGKSIIAVPFVSADDMDVIMLRMNRRTEMKRIRCVRGKHYKPRLSANDHLHIYNTTDSMRYPLPPLKVN